MKRAAGLAAAVLLLPIGAARAQDTDPGASASGPNVVIVMTDDQRYDDMAAMPITRNLIGGAGVTFTRSYVSYPVCCPSRATFLTGQYAHNNGVRCLYPWCGGGFGALKQEQYLPVWLEDAGYVTAHIGKFLNGYGKERPPDKPNGWTEWYGLIDHYTYRMWGFQLFENDQRRRYGRILGRRAEDYQTDVLTRKAVDFISRRAPDPEPFFLSVAYLAPHHESAKTQKLTHKLVRPAPRHRGSYANLPLPRPPNYNESDLSDKPSFLERFNPPINASREAAITTRLRERWESLLAVDDGVKKIIDKLQDQRELNNTYVIFTSDHGFMQGEHRIPQGKMVPYDESTQVPLLIRGPRIPRGGTTKALVGNVDLAPTILEATGARATRTLDGRSFLRFARNLRARNLRLLLHETAGQAAKGRTNTREGGVRGSQPRVPAWSAVRTTQWLYIEYKGGQRELYNTTNDRWQRRSRVRNPKLLRRIRTLRRQLQDLRVCRGTECARVR